jgi:hypothetical protein
MPKKKSARVARTSHGEVKRYTNAQWLEIISRVAGGETLAKICSEPGMPHPNTLRKVVLKDTELREQWEMAKEMRAHAYFDKALDLADRLITGNWDNKEGVMARALKDAIDTLKWAASRLNPREYGERVAPTPTVPIQIITSLTLDGRAPRDAESIYTVHATPVIENADVPT